MPSSSGRPTALSGGRIRSGMVPALSGALRRLAGRNKRQRPLLDPGCLTGSVNQSEGKKDRRWHRGGLGLGLDLPPLLSAVTCTATASMN